MPKLPLLTAKELAKVLGKLGFEFKRQRKEAICSLSTRMGEQQLFQIIPEKTEDYLIK